MAFFCVALYPVIKKAFFFNALHSENSETFRYALNSEILWIFFYALYSENSRFLYALHSEYYRALRYALNSEILRIFFFTRCILKIADFFTRCFNAASYFLNRKYVFLMSKHSKHPYKTTLISILLSKETFLEFSFIPCK